jgi:hypothetical protein
MTSNYEPVQRRALFRRLGIAGGTALAIGAAGLAGGMPVMAAAASPAASGGWSRPGEIPAPPGGGQVTGLSCFSRSDCTAVGSYQDQPAKSLFFATTERRGAWGKVLGIAVPAGVRNVSFADGPLLSCPSSGNCLAGISYNDADGFGAAVVSETNGTWGKGQKVHLPKAVPDAISAFSCPAPGDCTVALANGYLLNETHGTWRKPFPVPGLAALHGSFITLGPIDCSSPGNCSAAGNYNTTQSFVVTERNGVWGDAKPVTTSQGAGTILYSLACTSAANCVAGGYIYPLTGSPGGFVVTETHGRWGPAESVPGTLKLGGGGIEGLDCPAPGACRGIGSFVLHRELEPFVSTEKNGIWQAPQIIVGGGPIGTESDSLACVTVSSCVLAGSLPDNASVQAATAAQAGGRWGPATLLRGIRALDDDQSSAINALSCPSAGHCTAIGSFGTSLFVTTQR